MNYASLYMTPCYIKRGTKMGIIAKLFLLVYLLVMVMATIVSVVWILTAIFKPEWSTKKTLLMKFQKIKAHENDMSNKFRE
jgi:hypothetical protein